VKSNRGLLAVIALAVVDLALFLISGVPRFKDATHGTDYVIGEICWLGFLIGVLALIVTGVVLVVRRARVARRAGVER
jgi:hypothetical protein